MLSIDQARAGGEGMASAKIKDKDKDKDKEKEMAEGPDLFQSADQKVEVKVPEGWHSKPAKN